MSNVSYGFQSPNVQVPVSNNVSYLRKAGLHTNARLVSIKYDATESYEYFDIQIDTADGKVFRERTFAPNVDKVFPKKLYKDGVEVGEETKEEAFNRAINEVSTKLYILGAAFVEEEELRASVAKAASLKEFVDKVNKVIQLSGNAENPISFLTVWKNNDNKQVSNLVVPANTKWAEAYVEGKQPTIKLNKWQIENQTTEKYPYQGNKEVANTDAVLVNESAGGDLPF